MIKAENRAWFFHDARKFSSRVYVMYDQSINPTSWMLQQGRPQSLSGFRYELSSCYNEKKNNTDYLYKSGDKTVKFHAANTDDRNDKELKTWSVTCDVLQALQKNHTDVILAKACLEKEPNLLQNSSFEDEVKSFVFNVEKTKRATLDYLLKWDFLPNSEALMLANERALKVLEEVAGEDFQALPAEIRMYDGTIIDNYKLINITKRRGVINKEKSILKPGGGTEIWNMYKVRYYDKDCLGETNLARLEDTCLFVASSKVKEGVTKAKLKGLEFDNQCGGVVFIE